MGGGEDLHQIDQWAGVQTIVMVKRVRQLWNQTTVETVFYLSSLPCDVGRIAHRHSSPLGD